jgi:hypothetical protein
LITILQKIFDA